MGEVDQQLLLQLREGSYKAFEAVYNRFKVPLASSMLRQLKSADLVEDLLQELFVRLWEHRHAIDPSQSIQAYLYRIAENLIYDTFRKVAKDTRLQYAIRQAITENHSDIEAQLMACENREILQKAISMLPPKRREVYILCKLESKSYEEVSGLLNISLSTINDHIYKANQFLRHYLAKEIILMLTAVILAGNPQN